LVLALASVAPASTAASRRATSAALSPPPPCSQRLAVMLASAVLHALKARAKEVAPGVAPTIEGALVRAWGDRQCHRTPWCRAVCGGGCPNCVVCDQGKCCCT